MNAPPAALESRLPMLRRRERISFWWAIGFVAAGLLGIGLQVVSYFVTWRAMSAVGSANPSPEQLAEAISGGMIFAMGGVFFIICGGVGLLVSLLVWLLTMRRRRQVEGQLQASTLAGGRRV